VAKARRDEPIEVEEEAPAPLSTATAIMEPEPDDGRQWYVIHTYSGYENKVKKNLEHRIQALDLTGHIFRIVVPTEEEIEIRDGQRRNVQRKVYPGYVLIQMLMTDEAWYLVRNTPGVTGFVGMGTKPTALGKDEAAQILRQMEAEAPRVKVTYQRGQIVKITDGPFADFEGKVDDVNQEKGKVRVLVSIFGRETPVELDFLQIDRIV
jgi:transcriptional antiterminator NusG